VCLGAGVLVPHSAACFTREAGLPFVTHFLRRVILLR
jgi:hypothetical protein